MASTDYYSDNSRSRTHSDAPLPPLPPSAFSRSTEYEHSTSPITSPFDDLSYQAHGRQSQQSLPPSNSDFYGGGRDYDTNPFSDDIPLKDHAQRRDLARDQFRYEPDSTSNLAAQDTRSNRRSKKRGVFSGKTPWVTYALTLIQSIVFLVELIKNGKATSAA